MIRLIYKNVIQGNMSKIKDFPSEKEMNEFIRYFANEIHVIEYYKV